MANYIDMIGEVFGRLTVIEFSHIKQRHAYLVCNCVCGGKSIVTANRLKSGKSKSCGCLAKDVARETCIKRATHGMAGRKNRGQIYSSWANMKQRCLNSGRRDSPWYHDKGIFVCEKWMSFRGFLDDMGSTYFDGASLERKSNDDGYHKDNCEWVQFSRQSRNRTDNRILVIDGVEMCMADAAEKYNMNYNTLRSRIYKMGMDHKEAVTKPVKSRGKNE